MKCTSLLSIYLALTFTTISFSQESVIPNMGEDSSGFGSLDVEAPQGEQQNDCPEDNNDEVNQSTPAGNSQQVVPNQSISMFDINKYWLWLPNLDSSWICTARTNKKAECMPRTKQIKQKPQRKRFVLSGNYQNGNSASQRSKNEPSFDNQVNYPRSYACNCCCHLSKGGSISLTTNSGDLDDIYDDSSSSDGSNDSNGKYGHQSNDHYNSTGKDDQNGYEDVPCGRGNDGRQSTRQGKTNYRKKHGGSCDNKDSPGKTYDYWSDDNCQCTCNCKRFSEVIIYD